MKRLSIMLLFALVIWALGRNVPVQAADTSSITVMAVGDIACDPTSAHFNALEGDTTHCQMKATSDVVLNAHPDGVLALGDNQYENASIDWFQQSYDPTWGRFKAVTHPVPGNHEYVTDGAAGYYAYFGAAAGSAPGGYYSFDLGGWHFIALNSWCQDPGGCGAGSAQERWLLNDLATHRNACTLAYWHYPRFTSGPNLNHPEMATFWDDLYANGAEIVLNGHDHQYERFAPQNPRQQADPNYGIRELVVGTGGDSHTTKDGVLQPNSEIRDRTTFGVLRLTLRKDSYDWKFIAAVHEGNGKFTDAGTGTCHGISGQSAAGLSPQAVPVVSAYGRLGLVTRFTVTFQSTKPGQGYVLFGPGPGCMGLTSTALSDTGTGTTSHSIAVTGNDLPSSGPDIGLLPGTTYWYEVATRSDLGTEIDNNEGKCYSVTTPSAP